MKKTKSSMAYLLSENSPSKSESDSETVIYWKECTERKQKYRGDNVVIDLESISRPVIQSPKKVSSKKVKCELKALSQPTARYSLRSVKPTQIEETSTNRDLASPPRVPRKRDNVMGKAEKALDLGSSDVRHGFGIGKYVKPKSKWSTLFNEEINNQANNPTNASAARRVSIKIKHTAKRVKPVELSTPPPPPQVIIRTYREEKFNKESDCEIIATVQQLVLAAPQPKSISDMETNGVEESFVELTNTDIVTNSMEENFEPKKLIDRIIIDLKPKSLFDDKEILMPIEFPNIIHGGRMNVEPKPEIVAFSTKTMKLIDIIYSNHKRARLNFNCIVEDSEGNRREEWLDILIVSKLQPKVKFLDYMSRLYLYHQKLYRGLVKRAEAWDKITNRHDRLVPLVAPNIIPAHIRELREKACSMNVSVRRKRYRSSLTEKGL